MRPSEGSENVQPLDFLLMSTADWDNPFWTNKQHTAIRLARRGYRVLYVESVGLRRPTANARDLGRIWKRLAKGIAGVRQVENNLWVLSPLVLPFHGNATVAALNRRLLTISLNTALKRLEMVRPVLWTYNPLAVNLIDALPWASVVYHCVDELSAAPGVSAEVVKEADDRLTRLADRVFCTAPTLYEARRHLNPHTYFLPNVADFEHFGRARSLEETVANELVELPQGPRLGFVGAINQYKLDLALIEAVARARPNWQIIMIGQVGEGEPGTRVDVLRKYPNIHLLGPRHYADLPRYLKGFDVGILPNVMNEYTRNMFPMKFFEYLAAGVPVVATPLPALKQFGHVCLFGGTPAEYIAQVELTLAGNGPALEERLREASQHTWDRRLDKMLDLLRTAPLEPSAEA